MEKLTAPRASPDHIAVCGAGLAGYMAAAALSRALAPTTRITLIVTDERPAADMFYGSVATPAAYAFNLALDVTEPRLILNSNTAFSLGTQYRDWGGQGLSWVQGYQLPLAVLGGVPFHHYLTGLDSGGLEPFLISAQAGRSGAFAHPPENATHPLSRAEYGYQLDPASYAQFFAEAVRVSRVRLVKAEIAGVDHDEGGITAVRLGDGETLRADLYVDATGPEARLLSCLGARRAGNRRLAAVASHMASDRLGPALRTVTGHDFGWHSRTPLQDGDAQLSVYDGDEEPPALDSHHGPSATRATAPFGAQDQAWLGNCVAVGQAAAVIEPLTPAPIVLLQADVERLVSLIPLSDDMAMERREYNRQFTANHDHAEMFRRALFATTPREGSAYWQGQAASPDDAGLERKIAQFLGRGLLVSYDLEPFTPEDWTILHYGMGRRPQRRDRLADKAEAAEVTGYLERLKRDIAAATRSLPPHHRYVSELKRYLTEKGM